MDIVQFYRGEIPNNEGNFIDEILSWSFDRLEMDHSYIQWLFPLEEKSNFNIDAPILTTNDIKEFRKDVILQEKFLFSFHKILLFFGFVLEGNNIRVQIDGEYHKDAKWLFRGFNHNMLRITRVLRSLYLLEQEELSKKFLEVLRNYRDCVSENTWNFWESAIVEPTNN